MRLLSIGEAPDFGRGGGGGHTAALAAEGRLLRFGSELLFPICEFFHVDVVVLDAALAVYVEQ
jgi:hypothetical protein